MSTGLVAALGLVDQTTTPAGLETAGERGLALMAQYVAEREQRMEHRCPAANPTPDALSIKRRRKA